MDIIPYERFTVKPSLLDRLNEYYVSGEIKRYFDKYGVLPSKEIVDTFILPEGRVESYKKYWYAEYYRKELEYEELYGPSEMIETTFDFSATEDNDSVLLGTESPTSSTTKGDSSEYQYEYWTIVIKEERGGIRIGSFTSLENISVKLNSIKKYDIYAYHRKSNYLYDKIATWNLYPNNPRLPIELVSYLDNEFHDGPARTDELKISDYSGFQTQLEDKEYIGIVKNYVPEKGKTINGSVYLLNPQIEVNISGLTKGTTFSFRRGFYGNNNIDITYSQDGNITTNGDLNRLTILSDKTVQYLMLKSDVVNCLSFEWDYLLDTWENNVPDTIPLFFILDGKDENGNNLENLDTQNYTSLDTTIPRNGVKRLHLVIPPQGEDIDTGFDFDVVDDGNENDGSWIRLSKNDGYLENPTDSDNVVLTWDYNSGYTRYVFLNYTVEIQKDGAQENSEFSFWLRQEGDLGDDPLIPQNIKELLDEEQPWQPVEDEEIITDWEEYLEKKERYGLRLFRIRITNADLAKNGGAMQITAYNMFNGNWSMSLTDVDPKTINPS